MSLAIKIAAIQDNSRIASKYSVNDERKIECSVNLDLSDVYQTCSNNVYVVNLHGIFKKKIKRCFEYKCVGIQRTCLIMKDYVIRFF